MSVKAKFCKTINELQDREMNNFIEAVKDEDFDRASRILDSLASIFGLSLDVCEIDNKGKNRD